MGVPPPPRGGTPISRWGRRRKKRTMKKRRRGRGGREGQRMTGKDQEKEVARERERKEGAGTAGGGV